MNAVPFTDLRAMHEEVRTEIESAWRELVDRSAFVGGQAVVDFEREFATYCQVPYAVGVGSGTDALRIGLQAVGVRPGEIVLTVPHTFIATVEAITQAGAAPVFVDIDPVSYTMDPRLTARYLERECVVRHGVLCDRRRGARVACVLPVDLYGQPADLGALCELAEQYGVPLVEDACQAHGAEYKGRRCGSFGKAAAFSFYPGKNLGAMGEAGAITTSDAGVAERCRVLRDHGQSERYIHVTAEGGNARLDAIQAVVLRAKLKRVETWNERRREVARWYREALEDVGAELPTEMTYARHVYHLFVIQLDRRDQVRAALDRAGISTGLHYPVPLHLQQAYRDLGHQVGDFPVSELVAGRGLSLPLFPHLGRGGVESVAAALKVVSARGSLPLTTS